MIIITGIITNHQSLVFLKPFIFSIKILKWKTNFNSGGGDEIKFNMKNEDHTFRQ